jgi:RNA polymerase sigma-70 factor (ECF subfamily)
VSLSDSGIKGDRGFPATASSIFRGLREPGSPEYQRTLEQLIEAYWKPVYCVIRHGGASNQDAKDLTQDFFASHVLEGRLVAAFDPARGSFRSLLRTAIVNFLHDRTRTAQRQKRGGAMTLVALDQVDGALTDLVRQGEGLSPEQVFDAAWNHVLFARAVERLEARLRDEGKSACFEVFRRYDLDDERDESSYADVAQELGISPARVRHGLAYARAALEQTITALVSDYAEGPAEVAAELRNLFAG